MADRSNNERMKLALIPVLGIVLFFVLPEGESSGTPEVVSPPAASEDEGDAAQKHTQSTFRPAAWPETQVNTILAHNPFELRDPRAEMDRAFADAGITVSNDWTPVSQAEFLQLDRAVWHDRNAASTVITENQTDGPTDFELELSRRQQRLTELRAATVSMILKTDKGLAAVINGHPYRANQELETGIRVVSVESDGVTLEVVTPGKGE